MFSIFRIQRCSKVCCIWSQVKHFSGKEKFYKEARICHSDGGFEINLDNRKLRTPNGNIVKLPTESLAQAVSVEWNNQNKVLKLDQMPLTTLCFSAVENKPTISAKTLVSSCFNYLHTDTILCRINEPPELEKFQSERWDPMVNWLMKRHSIQVTPSSGFAMPVISENAEPVLSRYLLSYNYWSIIGFERMVSSLKSLIVPLALVDREISVEEAVSLSRLELEYQISKWGNIAWHHDIELAESRMKTAAAVMFIQLCSEDSKTERYREALKSL
uniref:ATP synthase mitochondrial F1 complex assembly factor 2-like n=1 Tax=Ciona intestinalis TaxID=7719 RepID=F6XCL4_CIOIN|nr:ATP synthase mitochondrial F1 complex assembly factor 2-like [Ciona intestinalis]|eukprot:XP_002131815.1 ATP synthase mitochondrial F1 complex assembly factor 2-like [Ciona intestinalis]